MGAIIRNINLGKPKINEVQHNVKLNGEKVWKAKSSPYSDYLTNMFFALDYHDVIYNGNTFNSIIDSSGNNTGSFTGYNMGQVTRAADGSMNWQLVSDSYRYVEIPGLNSAKFGNGMTIISMFKPITITGTHLSVGTRIHGSGDRAYQQLEERFKRVINMGNQQFTAVWNVNAILNRYVVLVTVIDSVNKKVKGYGYYMNNNILTHFFTPFESITTANPVITSTDICIGVHHTNDVDVANWGQSIFGTRCNLKYLFFWNESFNQTKIENFINEVLINEF